jgi:hypothetical protein
VARVAKRMRKKSRDHRKITKFTRDHEMTNEDEQRIQRDHDDENDDENDERNGTTTDNITSITSCIDDDIIAE